MFALSQHFTLEEFTRSETATRLGIVNKPPSYIVDRLFLTADYLESVRHILGDNPIRITSGYRSPELNVAVGGTRSSAHCFGYAVDFVCPAFGSPVDIAKRLLVEMRRYDQMIFEETWIHLSFDARNRRQVLTKRSGEPYLNGIIEKRG